MSQFDYIKEIAKYGLENNQEELLKVLNDLVTYSKQTKKTNFAIQLQSILKEGIRNKAHSGLSVVGSQKHLLREEDNDVKDFIIEKLTSDYNFDNLVISSDIKTELRYFVSEHQNLEMLQGFDLPVSNKILFHGASGCGKTLASYVMAGELDKIMIVISLGAIVSSKLGETSKNLAKIFRRAASEECVIFLDEFDSLGKMRDTNQDHAEMKRVVNTILQLFDYLPQKSIIIAATNSVEAIDPALMRRFDLKVEFNIPSKDQIKELIQKTLKSGVFTLDKKVSLKKLIELSEGLSFYTIQRTLLTAIKRSLLNQSMTDKPKITIIDSLLWQNLIKVEQENQH